MEVNRSEIGKAQGQSMSTLVGVFSPRGRWEMKAQAAEEKSHKADAPHRCTSADWYSNILYNRKINVYVDIDNFLKCFDHCFFKL